MQLEDIKNEVQLELTKKRYDHTIRVVETALELAKLYKVDPHKTMLAALLHDYAKEFKKDKLIEMTKEHLSEEASGYLECPEILHGYVGAYIAKHKFNVQDEDILNAIKYHTTGRKKMTLLEKIIYLADATEPKRVYPGVDGIRSLAHDNLDKAVLLCADESIRFLLDKGAIIHPDTINLRNWLLKFN